MGFNYSVRQTNPFKCAARKGPEKRSMEWSMQVYKEERLLIQIHSSDPNGFRSVVQLTAFWSRGCKDRYYLLQAWEKMYKTPNTSLKLKFSKFKGNRISEAKYIFSYSFYTKLEKLIHHMGKPKDKMSCITSSITSGRMQAIVGVQNVLLWE